MLNRNFNFAVSSAAVVCIYFAVKSSLLTSETDDTSRYDVVWTSHEIFRFSLPFQFNRTCSDNRYLGMPARVKRWCAGNSTDSCNRLTCENLLRGGDPGLYEFAVNMSAIHTRPPLKDIDLVNETADCAAFRRTRGFRETTHPEAADFPIVYNILTHGNAHQVARLLRAIYRPNNLYCFHVDVKSPPAFQSAISALVRCFDNIRFASRSEKIVWAGFSRLQADITCMKDHLDSGKDWKYLINTAAFAFPLRTVEETVKILRIYRGANDIEGIFGARVHRSRFENEWIELQPGGVRKTGRLNPKPPHNIDIVRGSAYGIFSRKFVEFIVRDQRARDLLEWSRRTWSPDEFYWSTLHHIYANPHLHTPGGYPGYPSSKPWLAVYANWGEKRCYGRHVRGVCVFGEGDLPLLQTRKELFANKFFQDFHPLALDCMEAWIRHKEECPLPDDLEYYRQLPFIPAVT